MTTISRALAALTRVPATALARLGLLLAVPLAATRLRVPDRDAGMSTAEYAVGTVAAVAFAAVRKTTNRDVFVKGVGGHLGAGGPGAMAAGLCWAPTGCQPEAELALTAVVVVDASSRKSPTRCRPGQSPRSMATCATTALLFGTCSPVGLRASNAWRVQRCLATLTSPIRLWLDPWHGGPPWRPPDQSQTSRLIARRHPAQALATPRRPGAPCRKSSHLSAFET